jgi:hypothetical protein
MSQTIEIHTKQTIEGNDLFHFLQDRLENVKGMQKSEEGLYFYVENESLRGVDFWKETYGYELRITILSNAADYEVAKWILSYCINFVADAKFYFEEELIKKQNIVFLVDDNSFIEDAQLVKTLVTHHQETITFFGPKEEFYIGSNVLQKVESTNDGWEERLEQLLLKVQYHLPPSENDEVMATNNEAREERKILKLVNRNVTYILKKYDYLIFRKDGNVTSMENMVFVTNEDLNQNLPETWELIDEYTITAPALSNEEYDALVGKLLGFDCREEFENNQT